MAEALLDAPAGTAPRAQAPCAIVVPAYNGYEHLARCLAALERHTSPSQALWLVDDASPDPRVLPLLRSFAQRRAHVHVLENASNLGFVGAVNAALARIDGDAVILNADTEVTSGWLEAMQRCRASDPRIGIVCPLSNNATLLSVPAIAPLFGAGDADAIAACARRAGPPSYPRIPTAVGFCMLLTRELREAVGALDPAFARGYGEENDLSMRALDRGFEIACCDDAYVHHAGEASFGQVDAIDSERERNRKLLERRWPTYAPGVSAWMRANPLRATIERVNAQCERERFPGRLRVLHVVHAFDSRGGVEEHTRGVIEALRHDVVFNVAVARGAPPGSWLDFAQERPAPHLRISRLNPDLLTPGVQVLEFAASVRDASVERAFRGLLAGSFDVVHFHSPLAWNTMQLPRLAKESGARVVLSAHEMAWMCAEYNMVTGPDERPCGRSAARASDAGCVQCLRSKSFVHAAAASEGIAAFIEERYAASCEAVAHADAIVCPSTYVARRIEAAFGATAARKVRVIGHGVRELQRIYRPSSGPALTVALVGRFSFRKGAHHFLQLAQRVEGERIAFEAWGPIDQRLAESARRIGVRLRGPYDVADLAEHLGGVDLVMIPSTLEETYCLALSEMHALGIPVAASRSGAIPERIRDGENGFLFDVGDIDAMARIVLRVRDDRALLHRVAARIAAEAPATMPQNAAAYLALYRELAGDAPARRGENVQPMPVPAKVLGFPRARRRTPLGDDEYDRWLATEAPPAGAALDFTPDLIVFTGAGADAAQRTQETLRGAGATARSVTLLPRASMEEALLATNRAIAGCSAEWIVFAEAGDTVAEGAFTAIASEIGRHPGAALVYGDHDAISARGERYDPVLKPRFDPELLRHVPYIAGLCALRRERCLEMGGLRAPGWPGVVDFALRLAASNDRRAVASTRALLCHRLDANLRALDDADVRRAMNARISEGLRREGARPVHLAATGDAAPLWAYRPAGGSPISVHLRCTSPQDALACFESLVPSCGARIGEMFVELPEAMAAELRAAHARLDATWPLRTIGAQGPVALGASIAHAAFEWIAIVDARCRNFTPGWLERLEQGVASRFTAGIAPDLAGPNGERVSGAWIAGAGAWSVAGPMPPALGNAALAQLYASPRAVSCLAPHLSLWRRDAVQLPGIAGELEHAGRFDIAHIAFALGARGHDMISRPFVGAHLAAPPAPDTRCSAETEIPADVAWMRERWKTLATEDPHFHPALALTAPRVTVAPRFAPSAAAEAEEPSATSAPRICAFPFDRWGSGEMRVRQPCAALERAGLAQVAMMEPHDSGRAPNALEWRRLGASTLLAHNFFHDYQLVALDEYARNGDALRVLGMDDLLTQLPPNNPYAMTIYPDIGERIARALSRCHRLVVSTEPLADAYGRGVEVHVIPNALDERVWGELRNRINEGHRPRVGWAGARQHLDDLLPLEPVVAATAAHVDWVFLGMCPPQLRRHAAEFHDMVPVRDYPAKLASLALDVAVAPLHDHPFNRAKSDLKLLEYGILGIPVVASGIGAYRAAPVMRVAGTDQWVEAILSLARDRDLARRTGVALRQWVLTNRMLASMLPLWRRALSGRDDGGR